MNIGSSKTYIYIYKIFHVPFITKLTILVGPIPFSDHATFALVNFPYL